MSGETAQVIILDDHRKASTASPERTLHASVSLYPGGLATTSEESPPKRLAEESVPIERLYGLGDPDQLRLLPTEGTVGLIQTCTAAIDAVSSAIRAVEEDRRFEADLAYMEVKKHARFLGRFIENGDGIALVISAILKCVADQRLAHESKESLFALLHAFRLLKNNPRMTFERAMSEVDKIEEQVGELVIPGYNELATLLLDKGNQEE